MGNEPRMEMDLDTFNASLGDTEPPGGAGGLLLALWYDAKGDWHRAHEIAQEHEDRDGAWVHAYLHRKEGDLSNAAYWYRRTGKPVASGSLQEEWGQLVKALL